MTMARSLLYQGLYGIWAFLMCFAFLPSLILPFWASKFIAKFWTKSVYWLLRTTCGLTYRIEGADQIPNGPVLYASKHQSVWDTLFFPYEVEDSVIVLKRELFWLPFFGWYAKKYGSIGIDRGAGGAAIRQMLREARKAIEKGRPVVIFPEGTRMPPGEKGVYQSGVAALYNDLKVPVVPVALNSGLFWPRRRLIRRQGVITLRFLPPIPPGLPRKEFMRRLETDLEAAQADLCSPEHGE
ncbi:MAG: 1-acyl-sn-glycerol-3-phosphate acyltransferase [Rhodospirillaceae bacterium]|nr:1-acyl-sn-glycerol-3-phosphate acyltransferase [Rhodospirillaceae bacterium]|tara:strand:- start:1336 stop:2055 length:720 start_codon:yes stop_codon:yes gene_type:complete